MNKQGPNRIEWTDYTWNPIAGCWHGCRWFMPDGQIAICYAEAVAEGIAASAYPNGFEHHYVRGEKELTAPLRQKTPSKIFLGSMADVMGHWVPEDEILSILDVVRQADWHTFQLLTKNPGRLLKFADKFPPNLWIGVSMPPSVMNGARLAPGQQERFVEKTLLVFSELRGRVRWMSLEPLSFDVARVLRKYEDDATPDWLVIGAASNGRTKYQPLPGYVHRVLHYADDHGIPVFFKGNLEWSLRREEFPNR